MMLISLYLFSASVEGHKDMIQKAEHLTLQRDRLKALQILRLSLKKEENTKKNQKEVLLAMDRIGDLFFSEKVQGAYADAVSKNTADDLEVVHKEEPNNLQIIRQLGIFSLKKKDCKQALKWSELGLNLHPHHKGLTAVYLQAALCNEVEEIKFGEINFFETNLKKIYYGAVYEYLTKKYAFALNSLEEGLKTYPGVASLYLLKKKVLTKLGRKTEDLERLWLTACSKEPKQKKALDLNLLESCPKKEVVE